MGSGRLWNGRRGRSLGRNWGRLQYLHGGQGQSSNRRGLGLRLLAPGGLDAGQHSARRGLGLAGHLGGDLGVAHGGSGFGGLHLAISGRFGVAGGDTSGGLGRAAVGALVSDLGRCLELRVRGASAALVGGNAPVNLLLPRGRRGGETSLCAQGSSFLPMRFLVLHRSPGRSSGPRSRSSAARRGG